MNSENVLCLRPEEDFLRVGVTPPETLTIAYHRPDDPALAELIHDASALIIPAVGPPLAADLFEGSGVRLVQVTGAGVDRLDEAGMRRHGIPVANVPGGSNDAVAEYAVAASLILLRRFAWVDAEIRRGNYVDARARMITENLRGLKDLTVGVVGMGAIGMAVAQAFHRMGCRIVFNDPAPRDPDAVKAIGARSVELGELLELSDVVTLHVPLLPATKGLIGAKELARVKTGAVLINASRGGIVDEAALADSLSSRRLGGAAVDVFAAEPPDCSGPLFELEGEAKERILHTPHIAGVTRQSWQGLFGAAWRNIEAVVLHGSDVRNRVY